MERQLIPFFEPGSPTGIVNLTEKETQTLRQVGLAHAYSL
jgi:hypothetical protein